MKKIYGLISLAVLATLVSVGCAKPEPIYFASTFNEGQAERLMRPGRNKIILNSFVVQPGGDVITCAGSTAELVPATETAAEYVKMIFGSELGGEADIWDAQGISNRIANGTQGFMSLRAQQKCNADGSAVFENVGDGDFYLFSGAAWSPWDNAIEGFVFAQKVSVRGGETKKVVLSGRARRLDSGPDRHHSNPRGLGAF